MLLQTFVPRIDCCELVTLSVSARRVSGDAAREIIVSLQEFITSHLWDCGSEYFAGGTGEFGVSKVVTSTQDKKENK